MKIKMIGLISLLSVSIQSFGWSNVWQIKNQSNYAAIIQNESTAGQNGIHMVIPPAVDLGCGLNVTGSASAGGDVGTCAFTLPPRATVDKTWNFNIGPSRTGQYTKVMVNGRLTKFQNISDVRPEIVRMNDDNRYQWPDGQNYNIIIKSDGSVTLEQVK